MDATDLGCLIPWQVNCAQAFSRPRRTVPPGTSFRPAPGGRLSIFSSTALPVTGALHPLLP